MAGVFHWSFQEAAHSFANLDIATELFMFSSDLVGGFSSLYIWGSGSDFSFAYLMTEAYEGREMGEILLIFVLGDFVARL